MTAKPEMTQMTPVADYATLRDILNAVVALNRSDIRTLEDLRACINKDIDKNVRWLAQQTEIKDALLTALLLAEFYDDTGERGKRKLRSYWRGLKTVPAEVRAAWTEIGREWHEGKNSILHVSAQQAWTVAGQVAVRNQRIWYNWRRHWFDALLLILPLLIVCLAFRAQTINERNVPYVTVRTDASIPAFEKVSGNVELRYVPHANGAFTTLDEVSGRYALVNIPAGATLSKDQVLSPELSARMPGRRILSVPIKAGAFDATLKTPSEALMTVSARQDESQEPRSASFEVIVLRRDETGGNASAIVAIQKDDFDKATRLLGSHDVFLAQIAK